MKTHYFSLMVKGNLSLLSLWLALSATAAPSRSLDAYLSEGRVQEGLIVFVKGQLISRPAEIVHL